MGSAATWLLAARFSHRRSPRNGVFACTNWVWSEEERYLLPLSPCHCAIAISGWEEWWSAWHPRGIWTRADCCSCQLQQAGASSVPKRMMLPSSMLGSSAHSFPLAVPETLLKTLTKTSCLWRNIPNGRRIPA